MAKLIKAYCWSNGELLEQEMKNSELKYSLGWKTEPDEAMVSHLKNSRYTLENEIYHMKQRIEDLIKVEDSVNNLRLISVPKIPNEDPCGLSADSIKELIEVLNQYLLNNRE